MPTKVVLHNRLNLSLHLEDRGLRGLRRWKFLYRVHHHWARADGALCIARGIAQDWATHGVLPPERLAVVTNPVIGWDFDILAAAAPDHPWLSHKNIPVILGVGRLHSSKNFSLLLRAFAHLRRRRPCRLIILGEGEERPYLERLATDLGIAEDLSMLGFHPNAYAFMKAADVFALSSKMEALGFVIAEALAAGTPVVATDCPTGPREILADGKYGRLVPPGSADAMEEALAATLDAPAHREIIAAGRRHSVAAATAEFLDVIAGLP